MSNKNVSLDSMMDKTPRGNSTSIDLTQGKVEAKSAPVEATTEVVEAPKKMEAKPVITGAINPETIEVVDATDILPKRQPEPGEQENELMADLDAAVDRECESITQRVDALTEVQKQEVEDAAALKAEEAQAAEDAANVNGNVTADSDDDDDLGLYDKEDDDDIPTVATRVSAISDDEVESEGDAAVTEEAPAKAEVKVADVAEEKSDPIVPRITTTETEVSILDGVKNDELFDKEDELSDDDKEEADTDEMLESLKKEVKEKIMPARKSLDLSKFTISKKSISTQKAMKLGLTKQAVADWALLSAGRSISMTGLSGPEILRLNPENSSRNRLNTFRDMYRVIYDHIYDGNKPEFETWLKQTRFVDLAHIYFALYMATFSGSNFVNYSCPKCNKVFIKDVKFEDMVKYADEETKDKVKSILSKDTTSASDDSYDTDLVQISNTYVFGLRTPSIWNVIIETASLSDGFLERHSDLIDITSYIDAIYILDEENGQLIPVDTKPDPNDQAKTSARRIKAYYDIISSLKSEEFYDLRSKISEYDDSASKMTYLIPATTCPECATEIPVNEDITPDNMLFIRHQLAAIGNM